MTDTALDHVVVEQATRGSDVQCAGRDGERIHVEIQATQRGLGWVVDWLIERCKRYNAPVVIDARSALGSIIPKLEDAQVRVITTSASDVATACGLFYDDVIEGRLRHLDDSILNLAVAGAAKRPLGDAWAWNRKTATSNIAPLIAATNAAWASSLETSSEPSVYFI